MANPVPPSNIRRGPAKPYASVPRIDWSHPLAKGMVFYAYDAGGVIFDLVNGGGTGKVFSSTTHIARTQSKFGYGYKYPGTATSDSVSLPISGNTKVTSFATVAAPFSYAAGVLQTGTGTTGGYLVSMGSAAAGQDNCGFVLTGATQVEALLDNGTTSAVFAQTFTANVFHTLVAVATTTAAGNVYFDGGAAQSFAGTTVNNTGTNQVNFNTGQAGAAANGGGSNGFVFYFAGWNRVLTAIEAKLLHSDPYCFLIYPEDEVFATLVGVVAAAGNPFVNTDVPASMRVRQGSIPDNSFSLNPNLFKNPIPIFNQFEPAKSIRLPLALPIPPDPLNINLFTNPYPFNQSDWSKPFRVPLALPQPAIGINPNIFTNPYPFAQYDWSKPVRSPLALPTPPLPLNINIFTNPYPFNQTDWSKPIKVPQAPYSPTDPLNINLFTNPFPVLNLDTSRPSSLRGIPSPDAAYNPNLYIVTVVTAPFYAAEIFPVRRPPAAPLPDQPLNINLFTNPYPIFNSDQSFSRPLRGMPSPDVPYNFFTNPFPIFNSDQSSSRPFPRVLPLDVAYNQNLYSVTVVTAPFYAAEIFPVRRPVSSPLLEPPLNINIFTNPFPVFNSDQSSSRSPPRIQPIDPPYNQNIYSVTVTASLPFNQYDFTPSHFPAPRIVVDLPNLTILISVAPGAPPEVYNRPFFATVGQLMNIS